MRAERTHERVVKGVIKQETMIVLTMTQEEANALRQIADQLHVNKMLWADNRVRDLGLFFKNLYKKLAPVTASDTRSAHAEGAFLLRTKGGM